MQVEIWGLSSISNSVNLSHLVFCENIACEPHYCSCIRALNSVMAGPIVAFSANSGSIICNEAPLWHFLSTSLLSAFAETSDWISVECFCEGLWPGFGSGRFSEGLLQGIPWSFSYGLLRRLAVNVPYRNFMSAPGIGRHAATKPCVCCRANNHPAFNDGVSRSCLRRPAAVIPHQGPCARNRNGYPKARIVVASKPH